MNIPNNGSVSKSVGDVSNDFGMFFVRDELLSSGNTNIVRSFVDIGSQLILACSIVVSTCANVSGSDQWKGSSHAERLIMLNKLKLEYNKQMSKSGKKLKASFTAIENMKAKLHDELVNSSSNFGLLTYKDGLLTSHKYITSFNNTSIDVNNVYNKVRLMTIDALDKYDPFVSSLIWSESTNFETFISSIIDLVTELDEVTYLDILKYSKVSRVSDIEIVSMLNDGDDFTIPEHELTPFNQVISDESMFEVSYVGLEIPVFTSGLFNLLKEKGANNAA